MTRPRTLLFYILIGCGVLTGVTVIVFLSWRASLTSEADRQIAAIRAAGLPVNWEELNRYYPAVPDDQNAATVMQQAVDAMQNFSDSRSNEVRHLQSIPRGLQPTPGQFILMADYVAMNSNALAKLDEAKEYPACRYNVDYTEGAEAEFAQMFYLRRLALLEHYRIQSDFHAGRLADVSAAIAGLMELSRTLADQPSMGAQSLRVAQQTTAVDALQQRLSAGELADDEIKGLITDFQGAEKKDLVVKSLIGVRARNIPYFRMTSERLSQTIGSDENDPNGKSSAKKVIIVWRAAGFLERDLNFYLRTMQTNIALAGDFPVNFLVVSNFQQQAENSVDHNFYLLSGRFVYGFDRFLYWQTSATAKIRAAQLALQVESFRARHGQFPKSLNDLVPQFISAVPADPFDGKPMRYHTLTNGYVIYSVDRDLRDNNGRERPPEAISVDAADYDITFTVHR